MLTRKEAKEYFTWYTNGVDKYVAVSEIAYNQLIDKIYDEHEAQMKAKDEEIERLKTERDHFYNKYIQVGEHIGEWVKGTKARSIVAMLFWEWKKRKRLYIANGHRSSNAGWGLYEQANLMEIMFKQSYEMLKDNA